MEYILAARSLEAAAVQKPGRTSLVQNWFDGFVATQLLQALLLFFFVRLRTRCHAAILSADLLPNLQSRPDVPTQQLPTPNSPFSNTIKINKLPQNPAKMAQNGLRSSQFSSSSSILPVAHSMNNYKL